MNSFESKSKSHVVLSHGRLTSAARRIARPRSVLFGVLLTAAGMVPAAVRAADGHVISVTGTGKVEVLPDRVEMTGSVNGDGEIAADAVKKYRGNKRRAIEAMNALKVMGLSVEGTGMMVTSPEVAQQQQQVFFGGGNVNPQVAGKVSVNESLLVSIAGVEAMKPDEMLDTVMKVIDAGKDAGLTFGPKPMNIYEMQISRGTPATIATFRLQEIEPHRKVAYEKAMEDARANAQRLAKLAGVRVGKVVSIKEGAAEMPTDSRSTNYYYAMLMGNLSQSRQDYTATSYKVIPVAVALNVEFEIEEGK